MSALSSWRVRLGRLCVDATLLAVITGSVLYVLMHMQRTQALAQSWRVEVVASEGALGNPVLLQETLTARLRAASLPQDIHAIRAAAEAHWWVRTAHVRDLWRDGYEVRLEAHRVVGMLADGSWLMADSSLAWPPAATSPPSLRLTGARPALQAQVARILAVYDASRAMQVDIAHLHIRPTGAFELHSKAEHGRPLDLIIPAKDLNDDLRRLRQWVKHTDLTRVARVDLRHARGAAALILREAP